MIVYFQIYNFLLQKMLVISLSHCPNFHSLRMCVFTFQIITLCFFNIFLFFTLSQVIICFVFYIHSSYSIYILFRVYLLVLRPLKMHAMIRVSHSVPCPTVFILFYDLGRQAGVLKLLKMFSFKYFKLFGSLSPS